MVMWLLSLMKLLKYERASFYYYFARKSPHFFKRGVGFLPSVEDIIDNPNALIFHEVETPMLVEALDDPEVTMAVINNNFPLKLAYLLPATV